MTNNSLDSVADRDFCVEIASAIALAMVHLSRFSEEIIFYGVLGNLNLWSWTMPFLQVPALCRKRKILILLNWYAVNPGRVIGDVVVIINHAEGVAFGL